jgi:DTW domain-containing protein YfiP
MREDEQQNNSSYKKSSVNKLISSNTSKSLMHDYSTFESNSNVVNNKKKPKSAHMIIYPDIT